MADDRDLTLAELARLLESVKELRIGKYAVLRSERVPSTYSIDCVCHGEELRAGLSLPAAFREAIDRHAHDVRRCPR